MVGATTLIGSYTCTEFIKRDDMILRAVISLDDPDSQIRLLRAAFGEEFKKVRIVLADYQDESSLAEAFKRCKYVIHAGFDDNSELNEDKRFEQETNQMTAVLKACEQSQIKRLVITSSYLTMMNTECKNKRKSH